MGNINLEVSIPDSRQRTFDIAKFNWQLIAINTSDPAYPSQRVQKIGIKELLTRFDEITQA